MSQGKRLLRISHEQNLSIKSSQIIVLTARIDDSFEEQDNLQYLIKKPINPHILIKTLTHIIKGLELYNESLTQSYETALDHSLDSGFESAKSDKKPGDFSSRSKNITTNISVLMADDDASIRRMQSKLFSNYCKNVTAFSDGSEAVLAFKQNPKEFNLVVLDGIMPNLDGISATVEIRKFEDLMDLQPKIKIMSILECREY